MRKHVVDAVPGRFPQGWVRRTRRRTRPGTRLRPPCRSGSRRRRRRAPTRMIVRKRIRPPEAELPCDRRHRWDRPPDRRCSYSMHPGQCRGPRANTSRPEFVSPATSVVRAYGAPNTAQRPSDERADDANGAVGLQAPEVETSTRVVCAARAIALRAGRSSHWCRPRPDSWRRPQISRSGRGSLVRAEAAAVGVLFARREADAEGRLSRCGGARTRPQACWRRAAERALTCS